MSDPSNTDPMKAWRDWFVQSERDWSEQLTGWMKDDNVARLLGQEIHAGLYKQQMLAQSMAGPLAAMNLPSREDVVSLGERVGRLEDAVARVEALLTRTASPTAAPPARTRKAPARPRRSS
ncbi:hypothetical protein VARIO8X_50307 [Burkholderiales bacterium 8X]|nr:hypothetical protein VARIO8X_50307 [Burkholderiales bacterium 8X]